MIRTASILCGLLAIGLLGYAGYRFATDDATPPTAVLSVREPDRDLGAHPCDSAVPVSFRITNNSRQPIRIMGLVPG